MNIDIRKILLSTILVAMGLLLFANRVNAAPYVTVEGLVAMTNSEKETVAAAAIGYIVGAHDMTYGDKHCMPAMPADVLVPETLKAMKELLAKYPDVAKHPAAFHLNVMFASVAPCPTQPKS